MGRFFCKCNERRINAAAWTYYKGFLASETNARARYGCDVRARTYRARTSKFDAPRHTQTNRPTPRRGCRADIETSAQKFPSAREWYHRARTRIQTRAYANQNAHAAVCPPSRAGTDAPAFAAPARPNLYRSGRRVPIA